MQQKNLVRKKFYLLRKKKYFEINKSFFTSFVRLIKNRFKKKKLKIALYYPSSFEINVLKLLEFNYISNQTILLPIIEEKNCMNFFPWKNNEVLLINKYGMMEPIKSNIYVPNIVLVPLLSFDNSKHRIGYGKGYYDRYLTKYLKKFKDILIVGVAFSFQKHHKLPKNNQDVKLDYIITEKGIH